MEPMTVPLRLPVPLRANPCSPSRPRCSGAAAALAVLLCATPAAAGVYKCMADGGAVIYQEDPCPGGKELRNFETDPPDLSVIPPRIVPTAPAPAPRTPATASADKPMRDARPLDAGSTIGKSSGNAGNRKFIQKGMNEAEVLAKIGRPDATASGGGGKPPQVRWSYLPSPDDPDTVTTVTFTGGSVSDISRKVIKK
jgi:hypothetical protein